GQGDVRAAQDPGPRPGGRAAAARARRGPIQQPADRDQGRPLWPLRHRRRDQRLPPQRRQRGIRHPAARGRAARRAPRRRPRQTPPPTPAAARRRAQRQDPPAPTPPPPPPAAQAPPPAPNPCPLLPPKGALPRAYPVMVRIGAPTGAWIRTTVRCPQK